VAVNFLKKVEAVDSVSRGEKGGGGKDMGMGEEKNVFLREGRRNRAKASWPSVRGEIKEKTCPYLDLLERPPPKKKKKGGGVGLVDEQEREGGNSTPYLLQKPGKAGKKAKNRRGQSVL